jgi:methylase of polypeptide subunit release factors
MPDVRTASAQQAGAALIALVDRLRAGGYEFRTPTPATHGRVNARPENAVARTVRDVFGWSRPAPPGLLEPELVLLMERAGVLERRGALLASRVRVSSLEGLLFVHSAYPTMAGDAVFFGPDTYRFAALIARSLAAVATAPRAILDLGCGSGAGGILAARQAGGAPFVLLSDINSAALGLARVNAALAGVAASLLAGDLYRPFAAPARFDLIVANPPYLVDPAGRLYRDGGGALGAELSLAILRRGIAHLARGGRLVLYTGSAIVGGRDLFRERAGELLAASGRHHDYAEIDPDVFGEELDEAPHRAAERIAAVALTVAG